MEVAVAKMEMSRVKILKGPGYKLDGNGQKEDSSIGRAAKKSSE